MSNSATTQTWRAALSARMPRFAHTWRWLVPILLLLLFLLIVLWLPWQAREMETNEHREQLIADTLWVEQTIRFQLGRDEDSLRLIGSEISSSQLNQHQFAERVASLARNNREFYRVIWLDAQQRPIYSSRHNSAGPDLLSPTSRAVGLHARKIRKPLYAPTAAPPGLSLPILLDYHVPLFRDDQYIGSLVASYTVSGILEEMVPWWFAQDNEITLTDSDENLITKRSSGGPGRSVYTYSRDLELPGLTLNLRTNSVKSAPNLLPNLLVGSVIALALGLLWALLALWRDISRRLAAEVALHQQVTFRAAMENSLVTGMRARDLKGCVTYVNPAFCRMVGFSPEALVGKLPPMPYWAPDAMDEFEDRLSLVLGGTNTPQFETVFLRPDGIRVPVLVFESPLVDDAGHQTGWMASILDITERKKIEALNRAQQEKLQASARLASMGELASTLAHELNQPLAAISSYTAGAINLLQAGQADAALLGPALEKANTQAQRAGHIIRSVHEFVKQRKPQREPVVVRALIEDIIPLVELQASQFFVTLQTDITARLPLILADRVLLEQVLLNLTRNGIESMQQIAPERRLLRIRVTSQRDEPETPLVLVEVIDQGHGIPVEVKEQLFSSFFSTKAEGMGMGLNICRTAIEFHGGTLSHADNPAGGTIFSFSLPAIRKL